MKKTQFKQYKRWFLGLGVCVLIVSLYWLRKQDAIAPSLLQELTESYPRSAPAIFILIYILLTVALIPTLPLNVGSGFLWGVFWGTLFSLIGASLGALASFAIARYIARDYFNQRFQHPAWLWLHRQIEKQGWKSVAFTRINPIFSFGPLNYFFGITRISLTQYFWATAIFLIPPSTLMASLGQSVGGFTLDTGGYALLRNILICSGVFSGLTILRLVIKHWFGIEWDKFKDSRNNNIKK
ncbi:MULTISPECIES: TVP38/TMEM64 family protein [Spirulina sp. CCY15215]|uniref:TVP38/TMEM64 family protein n=1 Tax=Spirulina sp. CCY15215 TaxID=2767591 RepID=UPI00194F8828|nr:TVP38/TMEM64 family protein [Spirulina major]